MDWTVAAIAGGLLVGVVLVIALVTGSRPRRGPSENGENASNRPGAAAQPNGRLSNPPKSADDDQRNPSGVSFRGPQPVSTEPVVQTTAPSITDAGDKVKCSVFAPPESVPGHTIIVQVSLHTREAAGKAEDEAKLLDLEARRRLTTALASKVVTGELVEIRLVSNELTIDDPVESIVWTGELASAQFLVQVPAGISIPQAYFRLTVMLRGTAIGSAKFGVKISPNAAPTPRPAAVSFERYRTVFMSYSSLDRTEVLRHYQILNLLGFTTFLDVMALHSGERWEPSIYEAIEKADLFLLYWSENSAQSEWVIKEAEYALQLAQKRADRAPDILPVMIAKSPPGPLPPSSLSAVHVNDPVRYIIIAQDAEAAKKAANPEASPAG